MVDRARRWAISIETSASIGLEAPLRNPNGRPRRRGGIGVAGLEEAAWRGSTTCSAPEREAQVKAPAYAGAGVPEVWILDLPRDRLEVFRDPAPEGYGDVRRLGRGARVAPVALPEVAVPVEELLG